MVETKEYNEDDKEQIETYQRLYRQSIRHQIAFNNKAYYKLSRYTLLGWNKQKIIEKTKTGGGNILRKTEKNDWKSEAKERAKI